MKEEWRTINQFPKYSVSDHGRVMRSVGSPFHPPGRILKGINDGDGYPRVNLYEDGFSKRIHIHKLVLETFVGPCPEGKECNHKDTIKSNAKLENLEWCTHQENIDHSVQNGLPQIKSGHLCGCAKLKDGEVWLVRKLMDGKVKQKIIATMFNVDPTTISNIKRGKHYKYSGI